MKSTRENMSRIPIFRADIEQHSKTANTQTDSAGWGYRGMPGTLHDNIPTGQQLVTSHAKNGHVLVTVLILRLLSHQINLIV